MYPFFFNFLFSLFHSTFKFAFLAFFFFTYTFSLLRKASLQQHTFDKEIMAGKRSRWTSLFWYSLVIRRYDTCAVQISRARWMRNFA